MARLGCSTVDLSLPGTSADAQPDQRARANDSEDLIPDPNPQAMAQIWWSDKSFEPAFSGAQN